MLIIIYVILSFLIFFFSEDLKSTKIYKRFLKITFLIGWIGVLMEMLGWNFLCTFQCSLLTFSPFIVLLATKVITTFFKKAFDKEPFHLYRKDSLDGIWVKNEWDSQNLYYHTWYSISILIIPMFTITFIFSKIGENFC